MVNKTAPQYAIITILIMIPFLATCTNGKNNDVLRAKVILQGDALVTPPCPVTVSGVQVGTVVKKTLDAQGHPVLELDINRDFLVQLNRSTVFYIKSDGTKPYLSGEVLDETVSIANEDLVFLGFSSYTRYLGWRAGVITQKGIKHVMDFIDEALKSRQ